MTALRIWLNAHANGFWTAYLLDREILTRDMHFISSMRDMLGVERQCATWRSTARVLEGVAS